MLGGFGAKKDAASSRRVSGWVRAATEPSKVTNVMATEIQCNEPDCVPIETLIVVIGTAAAAASAEVTSSSSTNRWVGKVLKPLAQCTQEDVAGLDFLEFAVRGDDTGTSTGTSAETSAAMAMPMTVVGGVLESAADMEVEVEADEAAPEALAPTVGDEHVHEDGQWIDDMLQSLRARMTPLAREGRVEIMSHFERLFSELRRSAKSSCRTSRAGTGAGAGTGAAVSVTTTPSSVAPAPTPAAPRTMSAVTVVPMVFTSTAATASATAVAATVSAYSTPAYSAARRRPPPTRSFIAQTQRPPATATVKARAGADKVGLAGDGDGGGSNDGPSARHKKGVRPRGCPCCDPDAMDNIVDKLLMDSNL